MIYHNSNQLTIWRDRVRECRGSHFYTYFSHLTLLLVSLETDSIVPKKEVFSVPQLGQGPFRDRTMLVLVLVRNKETVQPKFYL